MTSEEARESCSSVIPIFRDAWSQAWTDLKMTYNNPDWDDRCRSTVLQMQAVTHAKRNLYGRDDVRILEYDKRHLFEIRGCCIISLKQLDSALRSRSYKTTGASAFYSQMEIGGLQGLPRFTVGLVPDADWIDFVGIYLTFPKSTSDINWALDITGEPTDINSDQGNFNEPSFTDRKRWRARRSGTGEQAATGV